MTFLSRLLGLSPKSHGSPANIFPTVAVSTAKTYTLGNDGDGAPPRGIIPHATGNFICTDWEDNSCTIPVTVGVTYYIVPKTIDATNAVAFSALY